MLPPPGPKVCASKAPPFAKGEARHPSPVNRRHNASNPPKPGVSPKWVIFAALPANHLDPPQGEVRRIALPRTRVNRGNKGRADTGIRTGAVRGIVSKAARP